MSEVILFFVEFDNGDSNCYQGTRVPTVDEAKTFCKNHIDSNEQWSMVVCTGEVGYEQAKRLWDLSFLQSADWPIFQHREDFL